MKFVHNWSSVGRKWHDHLKEKNVYTIVRSRYWFRTRTVFGRYRHMRSFSVYSKVCPLTEDRSSILHSRTYRVCHEELHIRGVCVVVVVDLDRPLRLGDGVWTLRVRDFTRVFDDVVRKIRHYVTLNSWTPDFVNEPLVTVPNFHSMIKHRISLVNRMKFTGFSLWSFLQSKKICEPTFRGPGPTPGDPTSTGPSATDPAPDVTEIWIFVSSETRSWTPLPVCKLRPSLLRYSLQSLVLLFQYQSKNPLVIDVYIFILSWNFIYKIKSRNKVWVRFQFTLNWLRSMYFWHSGCQNLSLRSKRILISCLVLLLRDDYWSLFTSPKWKTFKM